MSMLVGASPCALAISTPAAVLAGLARAARMGVLIKGGAHLEALGTIRAIAMDKTGTLTTGKPALAAVVTLDAVDESELLRFAAAVESASNHPIAQAVVAGAFLRAAMHRSFVARVLKQMCSACAWSSGDRCSSQPMDILRCIEVSLKRSLRSKRAR